MDMRVCAVTFPETIGVPCTPGQLIVRDGIVSLMSVSARLSGFVPPGMISTR